MEKKFIEAKVEVTDGLTSSQLAAWKECTKAFNTQPKSEPTESAKRLKDAVKQAEYDQCTNCGERNFERVENKATVTYGYYFKAGILQERPPRDNKGTHGKTSVLRCSNCKTIYNQKERKEGS